MGRKQADTGFPMAWSLLTEAATSARLDTHNIRHMIERWCAIAEASDHKEAVYAEAGDLIVNLPKSITELETTLDALSYALAALGQKQLRDRLPIDTKFKVDRALADARLPMTVDESNPILPPKTSARRVARRFAHRILADLNPPLGVPGGPCQVLQRIRKEVHGLRVQDLLVDDYEDDGKLENPEAAQIYDIEVGEAPRDSFIKKVYLLSHAQFRMDQRSISVADVKQALQEFTKAYSAAKSNPRTRFLSDRWDQSLAYGEPIRFEASRIVVVFSPSKYGGKGAVDLITTYPKGEGHDPRPIPEEMCGLL